MAVLGRPLRQQHVRAVDQQMPVRDADVDVPGLQRRASCAAEAGSGPLRSMMRARMLGAPAGTCSTIRYANGTSGDNPAARFDSASTPPADAPIATAPRRSL
ncbi:hypothetical protein O984_03765 [Mycobacterium avium 05-4293]|nr:hypothetical protein O984_03765 [Mycobacterium avium 05-4293]